MENDKKTFPEPTGHFKVVISYLEPDSMIFTVMGYNSEQVENMVYKHFSNNLMNLKVESVELLEGTETENSPDLDPFLDKETLLN